MEYAKAKVACLAAGKPDWDPDYDSYLATDVITHSLIEKAVARTLAYPNNKAATSLSYNYESGAFETRLTAEPEPFYNEQTMLWDWPSDAVVGEAGATTRHILDNSEAAK